MKTKKIIMSKDDLTRGTNPTQTDVALPILQTNSLIKDRSREIGMCDVCK